MESTVGRKWVLSRESKLWYAGDPRTSQEIISNLLQDSDRDVRQQAARNPAAHPEDLMAYLKQYPEDRTLSVGIYLLWEHMHQNK